MSAPTYLTPGQVHQLNEKHGWFQHGDAQSDVSQEFAQDAIEMHERMRAAAPELLAALQAIIEHTEGCVPDTPKGIWRDARAAVSKATGKPA